MSERPLVELFDAAILDLDGCTFHGDTAIPHVAESLATARGAGMRVFFLTNNSSRTQEQIAQKLTGLGIPTAPEETFSAAIAGEGSGPYFLLDGLPGLKEMRMQVLRQQIIAA